MDIQSFPTTIATALPSWQFRSFTVDHPNGGPTLYDPNLWSIDRTADDVWIILDERGDEIDTPDDKGQTIFNLVLHGIGWLHTTLRD